MVSSSPEHGRTHKKNSSTLNTLGLGERKSVHTAPGGRYKNGAAVIKKDARLTQGQRIPTRSGLKIKQCTDQR